MSQDVEGPNETSDQPDEILTDADVDVGEAAGNLEPPDIELPMGEAMRLSEAHKIMGSTSTNIIVLGGPYASGKTTLATSVYERFTMGQIGAYAFSGSATLMGFEKIAHSGRTASGRSIPDTVHTSRDASRLMYHLRVYEKAKDRHQDVLFVDLSGEEFTDICDSSEACQDLQVIQRADHFVLLVDGEKLVDIALRHEARNETYVILRRLIESEVLSERSRVDVLFSKWDLVEGHADKDKIKGFVGKFAKELSDRFGAAVLRLRFGEITARQPDGESPPATGIESLLPSWFSETQPPRTVPPVASTGVSGSREIDRFLVSGHRSGEGV